MLLVSRNELTIAQLIAFTKNHIVVHFFSEQT